LAVAYDESDELYRRGRNARGALSKHLCHGTIAIVVRSQNKTRATRNPRPAANFLIRKRRAAFPFVMAMIFDSTLPGLRRTITGFCHQNPGNQHADFKT
jgi:hypothetical protein